jgi:hypothetical protein
VLHVNATAPLDTEALARLIAGVPALRGVVHVNPTRLNTDPLAPGLLHRAHIANFRWLRTQCPFEVFAMDASNTLLLRPGLKAHMSAHAIGMDMVAAFGWAWHWEPALRGDLLFQRAGEACRRNQLEGSFMRADAFARVADWIEDYDRQFDALYPAPGQAPSLPREQCLLATALDAQDMRADCGAYILVRWGSQVGHGPHGDAAPRATHAGADLGWLPMEIESSLEAGRLQPLYWDLVADGVPEIADMPAYQASKFGIPRVGHAVNDPIRRQVGDHFGYRAWTLEAQVLAS